MLSKKDKINKGTIIMLISIAIKGLLYLKSTGVQYNYLPIFIITFGITALGILALEYSSLKNKKTYQVVFYGFVTFMMFADIMYYSYFESLTSVVLLKQVSQIGAITESIKKLVTWDKVLFLIDIPFVLYYFIKNEEKLEIPKFKGVLIGSGAVVIGTFIFMIASGKSVAIKNQEFWSYHITDIRSSFASGEELIGDDLEVLKRLSSENEASEDAKHFGIGKDKNLILIQIEAFQQFVINLDYNGQEVTPNLNKLIEDQGSIYFDEYFQLVGRGNTSDSEFITNNSLHPSMEEYTYLQYGDNTFHGLPWILRDEGYSSWVYHGFEKEFWNRKDAYVNQGFERFLSEEDYDFEEVIGFGISDKDFLDQTLEYMKEQDNIDDNPFYSFVITLSSHTPYTMDEKYHVLDIKEEHKDNIVSDYLQAVHYTDKCLGEFIDNLKEEGLYDNSVIALYGDHFGINNSNSEVFEPMEDILGERYNFDHIMNIPLIIHVPGEDINETISTVGSQIDFLPTILNILGLENEKGFMFGKDLINYEGYNFVPAQTVLRRGSFIDEDVIFVFSGDGIFENSRAIDRKTREDIDHLQFRDKYEKAIEEIDLGNLILKNDLMQSIIDSPNIEGITVRNENPLDDIKLIRDFKEVNDDIGVALSRNNILRLDLDDENLEFEEVKKALVDNPGSHLLVHSKTDPREEGNNFANLRNLDRDFMSQNRYIAEVQDLDDYFFIQRERYHNLVLNCVGKDWTNKEIKDFLGVNDHIGVIVERDKLDDDLKRYFKDKGIAMFVEDGTNLKAIN